MAAAWAKFWALRWIVKGPIIAVVALVVLGIVGGSATPEEPAPKTVAAVSTATAAVATTTVTAPAGAPSTPTPTAPAAAALEASVVDVVDGDTLDVRLDGKTQRIRLILVDTPEVFGGVQCFGREASDYTKKLLPAGTALRLERDVSNTDRFDRLLRYAYLADGRMVNELLVRDGFARVATFPPDVKYVDRLRSVEREAREAGRGLWSGCAASATPTSAPASTAVAPTEAFYPNCAAARSAGVAPIRRGSPGYRAALDGDGDGVACD